MASVAVAVVALGVLLAIGVQLRSAEADSRGAMAANRTAAELGRAAASARVALNRYLQTVSGVDRQALDSALAGLRDTAGGAGLVEVANATSTFTQKSQLEAVALLSSSSNIASTLSTLGELASNLSDPAPLVFASQAAQGFALLSIDLARLVALRDAAAAGPIKESVRRVRESLKALQAAAAVTTRIKKISIVLTGDLESLSTDLGTYQETSAGRAASLDVLQTKFNGVADEVQERLRASNGAFAQASDAAGAASEMMMTSLLVSAVAVLAIGIGLALVIGGSITRPILALTGTMRRLANGEFDAVVSGQGRKDEIGAMARAVEVFKGNGLELRRTEAARATSAQEQAEAVSSIGLGLARLADGDLTCRLDQSFPEDYRKLQQDFNAAMERLLATMRTVAEAADGLRSGTSGISGAADALSRRTEQQAARLEETAAALGEIAATVHRTAEGASNARDVVGVAKADAERSGEVVGTTVAAMAEIEQSSSQIAEIIGVIDEIASQTSLLALNAGIEAARAGDAGRGFAVVASEVRSLALRSAEAAKKIKTLIEASRQQVGSGVELVRQAGSALQRITGQVGEINAVVAGIAGSAQEQATAVAGVSRAMTEMDEMTQRNATMVGETAAASHALAKGAEELSRLVGRFSLGDAFADKAASRPAGQGAGTGARLRVAA